MTLPPGHFYGTGIHQEVKPADLPRLPEAVPGQHLWTIALIHRIDNPAAWMTDDGDPRERVLGQHNLIQHIGPLCFICEQAWSAQLEQRPCPGDPND